GDTAGTWGGAARSAAADHKGRRRAVALFPARFSAGVTFGAFYAARRPPREGGDQYPPPLEYGSPLARGRQHVPASRSSISLRGLGLGARLRPVVGGLFRALERVRGLEARRHRRVGAGENLVMLDVERAQPALLPHGQRDEIADLDQFGLAEMLVQPRPELVVDRQIPGDRLGIGERRLLPLVVVARALEVDEIAVVVLDHALLRRLHGALV